MLPMEPGKACPGRGGEMAREVGIQHGTRTHTTCGQRPGERSGNPEQVSHCLRPHTRASFFWVLKGVWFPQGF